MVNNQYDAAILGCGVLGLTIAQELTKKGLKVALVGKDLPEDTHSTGFASPWAGASFHSFATNSAEQRRDTHTFKEFERLSREIPELCERRPYGYFKREKDVGEDPWWADLMFDYRHLKPSEIPAPFAQGVTFEAYTLNTPLYLQHLGNWLRSHNVPIIRERVSSLNEMYDLPSIGKVNLVINASGLGARSLIGVEDSLVHPAKGQTILVEAPDVKTTYGIEGKHPIPNQSVYIIPRPGPANHVILGGCYIKDDWSTNIDKDVAKQILKDCYELCPDLDNKGGKGSIEDIKIVSHNVGLRPAREGGLRCELEHRFIGDNENNDALLPAKGKGKGGKRKVGVVHAYGIGGAGYQSSLGIAKEVSGLVDQWLEGDGKGNRKAKL
ncbi:D-amino-acid oxidase [Kwoniella mangroviensis CBS 8886]|nr:D-amino-acid oxidase [Kwoniella mangroviensis CBS 8886]